MGDVTREITWFDAERGGGRGELRSPLRPETYSITMKYWFPSLETVIREMGALSVERAVAVMSKVLDGIEHAHALGVQHRDLKPANIMLLDSGGVKVMDFGIARLLGAARMTRSGRIVGTLEYLAPERVRGKEGDVRSDLYSMGIVLYEMLTGRLPFTSDSDYDLMRRESWRNTWWAT